MPDYLRKYGPAERVTYGTTAAVTGGQLVNQSGRVMPAASGGVQPYGPVAPTTVADPAHVIGHATEAIAAGAVDRVRLYH